MPSLKLCLSHGLTFGLKLKTLHCGRWKAYLKR
nr:MAG TPA: hypothetical protein [Caudoviricetes sp.]